MVLIPLASSLPSLKKQPTKKPPPPQQKVKYNSLKCRLMTIEEGGWKKFLKMKAYMEGLIGNDYIKTNSVKAT